MSDVRPRIAPALPWASTMVLGPTGGGKSTLVKAMLLAADGEFDQVDVFDPWCGLSDVADRVGARWHQDDLPAALRQLVKEVKHDPGVRRLVVVEHAELLAHPEWSGEYADSWASLLELLNLVEGTSSVVLTTSFWKLDRWLEDFFPARVVMGDTDWFAVQAAAVWLPVPEDLAPRRRGQGVAIDLRPASEAFWPIEVTLDEFAM